MEVLKERLVTNAEVLEILKNAKGELTYEQKKTLELLKKFKKLNKEKTLKLVEELRKLGILMEKHIIAIANFLPEDRDDLRVVLHKDYNLFSDEEKDKILEIVKKFI